jgi:hypothetical protein
MHALRFKSMKPRRKKGPEAAGFRPFKVSFAGGTSGGGVGIVEEENSPGPAKFW